MLAQLIEGNRWRPLAATGTVIVVAAIIFFTMAGGGSSVRLPTPPHVAAAAKSGHSGPSQSDQSETFTPPESVRLTGCSVSVSDPRPPQGSTAETVSIVSVGGAQVRLEADYSHTPPIVHTGSANVSGKVSLSLPINHAAPGVTVPVKVTATLAGTKVTCGSSFTPVSAAPPPALTSASLYPQVSTLLPGAPTLAQLPALPPPTTNPGAPPPPVVPPPPPPPSPAALTVSTASLPAGQVGTLYSVQLQSTGGTPPVSWTASSLPPGLTVTTGGLISGTPTTAGSAAVTVTGTDSGSPAQTASATLSLTIASAPTPPPAALTVSTASLPAGQVGTLYSVQLQSTGGTPPVSWTASSLPPGLTVTTGGLISGTPTTAGSAAVTVTGTDSGSPAQSASATFNITIAAASPPPAPLPTIP